MTATVRERIVDNIHSVLSTISIANGYDNDIVNVQRWQQSGNTLRQVPCIILNSGDESKSQELLDIITCRLNIIIDCWVRHDKDNDPRSTDAVLNSLLGDIETALLLDLYRDSNAKNTIITGNIAFETTEGQPYSGIVVNAEILYRHRAGNPKQSI